MKRYPGRPVSFLSLLACLGMFAFASGCNTLPPGPLDALRPRSDLPRRGQVYLIRGWRGLWSEGVDELAAKLRAAGVGATVYQQAQADALGDALVKTYRGAADADPVVLVGFSFGADEAIRLAGKLGDAGRPVALLVTLDPVTPPDIPPAVGACHNFYQSNGAWDALPWLRGVPVRGGGPAARVVNTDIRRRQDLLEPGTGHDTLARNAKVHQAVVDLVLDACPPRSNPGPAGAVISSSIPATLPPPHTRSFDSEGGGLSVRRLRGGGAGIARNP